jgi:poly(3-hydroxybutyrate) depolymerase
VVLTTEYGYAYIPKGCDRGMRCRVHVVFHGCRQYHARIGEVFFRHTGYNEWADSNRIVLIYPQTLPTLSQSNGNGCWVLLLSIFTGNWYGGGHPKNRPKHLSIG